MAIILSFFLGHWFLSAFSQTFFLHRYASHRMFTMNHFWERFFHLFTILAQGPSYLNPKGYAILHRMHHAYSDTELDPHSPHHSSNFFTMMWKTKHIYDDYAYGRVEPKKQFSGDTPEWHLVDSLGQSWFFRVGAGALYTFFYIAFVPEGEWGWFFLLPLHWFMGPIHGAIVNWGGHKYGYVNFKKTKDESRNSLPIDFLVMGELFQNNHHGRGTAPNFAVKWFEVDPCYQIMRLMQAVGMIQILNQAEPQKSTETSLQLSA